MKRTIKTILCAAAAVLAAVSCQKSVGPVQTAEEGKGTIEVRVNGLMGEYNQIDATKAELVNTIRVSWKGGETVYVYDGSNCIGSLVASLEGTEDRYAVLSTDGGEHQIETPAQGTQILTLVYSPLLTEKQEASHDLFISLEAQSGEKAPFVAYATLKYNGETTITGIVVPFKFATSVIKVNCTGLKADTAIDQVTLSNVHTNCWVNIYGDMEPSIYGYTNGTITRTGSGTCSADQVNGEGEAVFQIAVPKLSEVPEARVLTVAQGADNFEDKNFTTKSLSAATSVNTVCQLVKKTNLPAGALAGEFTVNADGKKVHFSQGNLTYDVNASTDKWKFYEHQYDCASSYEATLISLFTWGYNAEKSIVPDGSAYDNVSRTSGNLEQTEDWGSQIGDGNTWRTLTTAEWQYLFNTRSNASSLFKPGVTVCGKTNCIVLLPDDWKWDENTVGTDWQDGGYSETSTDKVTWQKMHDAGAVCLPAADRRDGSDVYDVGDYGSYWSSTARDSDSAYYVFFDSVCVTPGSYDVRSYGFSVRLITECQ